MISIQTKTHIGADGMLSVRVPTALRETDVEVMLVLQPMMNPGDEGLEGRGLPPGFFEQTAGAWQGEHLERAPQGEPEEREALSLSHLLDTNVCIRHLNDSGSSVTRRLAALRPNDVWLCDIVKAELYYGAYRSTRQEQNLAVLDVSFGQFVYLPFDAQVAQIFGRIRASLFAAGTPIGPYDMQIAAIALANGLTLLTHNTREFGRVSGLTLEDWEE